MQASAASQHHVLCGDEGRRAPAGSRMRIWRHGTRCSEDWVEVGTPEPLQQPPRACCRQCTWGLTWPGRLDRARGRSSSCAEQYCTLQILSVGAPAKIQALCLAQALPHPHKLLQILLIPALDRRDRDWFLNKAGICTRADPMGLCIRVKKPSPRLESHCTRPCQFQIIALQGIMAQAQASVRNVTANKGHP